MNQMCMKQLNELEIKLKNKDQQLQDLKKKFSKSLQTIEKENSELREVKIQLMQNVIDLKQKIGAQEFKSMEIMQELESMKQRELDRLEETDLEDVDLISENTKKKQL